MTSNPDQEREEIKDGLRAVIEKQVSLLRDISIYDARGENKPAALLDELVHVRWLEYWLLVRRAAVDGTPLPDLLVQPTTILVDTVIKRLDAEGVGQVYTDYMWATNARRWAYLKAICVSKIIEANDAPARNSMLNAITGSGSPPKTAQEAQEIVDRVMAL